MKRFFYLLVTITLIGHFSTAQTLVTGRVTDSISGKPLVGATVIVVGTQQRVSTDEKGNFSLNGVSNNASVRASFIGYRTMDVRVNSQNSIDFPMVMEHGLDEVVVVGYGVQKRANVTGSVATVQAKDLTRAPLASTSNLLTGRLPGLISVQRSGQPGADAANVSIRGFGNALVIVDGVESSFNNIDANQIESVTILKDASASIYGARAGNGVILVTTKRGAIGKPVITLNTSATFQGVTRMPRMASAGQYAEMAREEWIQSGRPAETAPYTEEEVQTFYAGTDPQYPNTDWYKILTRDWAPQQQHNLSLRGGSDRIKYYGMVGFLDQRTMWVESGGAYKRYNLQSNIDAKILDNLNLRFDISGRVEDRDFSARGWGSDNPLNSIWGDFWKTSPAAPSSLPDPTKLPNTHFSSGIGPANLTSNRDIWGYNDDDNSNINTTLQLEYRVNAIPGLSAKAFGNYIKNAGQSKTFNKSFVTYNYNHAADLYTQAASKANTSLNISKNDGRILTGQFSLNYTNTFGGNHNISALAMYEVIDINSNFITARREGFLTNEIDQLFAGSRDNMQADGSASEMGRSSYIGRLTYDYRGKYLFETTFRADASAKFAKEDQWGYFPGFFAAWRISEESFMENLTFLNNLKIRASYGRSGNDNVGNFQYLTGYSFSDTYIFEGTTIEQGIATTGLANPYLTWEEIAISNVGLDFQLFGRKLYGELDAFYRTRTGIPTTRLASLPNTFGASLPQENINSLNNRGFEVMLGTEGRRHDFRWDISGNIAWSRQKWDHFEEPEYTDPDQIRINQQSGRWTDLVFGYRSDGLFTSMEEIQNLPFDQDLQGNSTLRPGDVKYIDVNEDGKLDWRDQVIIGKGATPRWTYGISTNFQYKDFDLAALFQGAFDHSVSVNLNTSDAVSPAVRYELRWTEENNNPKALEPRLGGSTLNNAASDYRRKSAAYIRLKQLSFGYNIPDNITKRLNIERIRIYLAGTNLFTIDQLKKFDLDPEMPDGRAGLYFPQQRTVSFGLNLSF